MFNNRYVNNIPRRKSSMEVADEFAVMYLKENMTVPEIAKETGYSETTIKKYLSRNGYYKRK